MFKHKQDIAKLFEFDMVIVSDSDKIMNDHEKGRS